MATLDALKLALKHSADLWRLQPLSDSQYSAGFDIFMQDSGSTAYQDFIIPQLSSLLGPILESSEGTSILEIGPGPRSVLCHLPEMLRRKIKRYKAYEPNVLFATKLETYLRSAICSGLPLPCLEKQPTVLQESFHPSRPANAAGFEKFDIILFCHSMYGMNPRRKYIERALEMLTESSKGGLVIVFHRDGDLRLRGLASHRAAIHPTGLVRVVDDDEVLDKFTAFIVGLTKHQDDTGNAHVIEWRKICRALGGRDETHPSHLLFSSPEIMVAFTRSAQSLPELTKRIPLVSGEIHVKNPEARLHEPASIVRPSTIEGVQQCVRWALKHGLRLTVIGGSHSGQCLWPNVVAIDMSAFDHIKILNDHDGPEKSGCGSESLVVVGAGCKSGDIISRTMATGLTVPMGSRPSVGAGLWLQGGIGHLARPYGLTSDAIVGAVVVSVATGQVLCLGRVLMQHELKGAVYPDNDDDLLWAMKGAGTNFGIVVNVTLQAYAAPTYSVRSWAVPLSNGIEARSQLSAFDDDLIADSIAQNTSGDVYLYCDGGKFFIGVTMYDVCATKLNSGATGVIVPSNLPVSEIDHKIVDSVGLFDTEMYMAAMHGGHAGGKTSSFKRCVFIKSIASVADILVTALESRPTPLCYVHMLHGGRAVSCVPSTATAFGCRDWNFACVVTGVWARDKDGSQVAQAAVQWVYDVVKIMLPLSCGVYGADLGPDPRDAALALQAFGPNLSRLARLKHKSDPHNVLAYACPLPRLSVRQKVVFLVTGESCAGKDFCAQIWASVLSSRTWDCLTVQVASISDTTKRQYADATGADFERIIQDRTYKERHRQSLTAFYQSQLQQRPWLPEEHFMASVNAAADVDVLFITGMRDEAPVADFSPLIPSRRVIELKVRASVDTRCARRGSPTKDHANHRERNLDDNPHSSLTFYNDANGDVSATRFGERYLLPLFDEGLQRLAEMVRIFPDFPSVGITFRHVLGIAQQSGGLRLCSSLLRTQFTGDWGKVDKIACCETGGFIFASSLAEQVNLPLGLIREAGKLPQPTHSVIKCSSHISSSARNRPQDKRIEMTRDTFSKGSSVVVVDDVLATGETMCAVLQLLHEAGIDAGNISVIVVAEFPFHRGRAMLRQRGFGQVKIQSLLVFDGAIDDDVAFAPVDQLLNTAKVLLGCISGNRKIRYLSIWICRQSLICHHLAHVEARLQWFSIGNAEAVCQGLSVNGIVACSDLPNGIHRKMVVGVYES
nr:adenine phosphoribosyltransferase [Quercus suber]